MRARPPARRPRPAKPAGGPSALKQKMRSDQGRTKSPSPRHLSRAQIQRNRSKWVSAGSLTKRPAKPTPTRPTKPPPGRPTRPTPAKPTGGAAGQRRQIGRDRARAPGPTKPTRPGRPKPMPTRPTTPTPSRRPPHAPAGRRPTSRAPRGGRRIGGRRR